MATQANELRPISIGIEATGKRKETDSMGSQPVVLVQRHGSQNLNCTFRRTMRGTSITDT